MKRCISIMLICVFATFFLYGCNVGKSDEELINDRIDVFLTAYNSGDYEEVLNCFTGKLKNTLKAATGIGNALMGGITGFDINMADLFGLGAGILSEGDILTVSNIEIMFQDDTTANAETILNFNVNGTETSETTTFIMSKENNDWFIKNIK